MKNFIIICLLFIVLYPEKYSHCREQESSREIQQEITKEIKRNKQYYQLWSEETIKAKEHLFNAGINHYISLRAYQTLPTIFTVLIVEGLIKAKFLPPKILMKDISLSSRIQFYTQVAIVNVIYYTYKSTRLSITEALDNNSYKLSPSSQEFIEILDELTPIEKYIEEDPKLASKLKLLTHILFDSCQENHEDIFLIKTPALINKLWEHLLAQLREVDFKVANIIIDRNNTFKPVVTPVSESYSNSAYDVYYYDYLNYALKAKWYAHKIKILERFQMVVNKRFAND